MPKANSKLGKNAVKEINETIERCANSTEIRAEVERLAAHFPVTASRIYEMTKHLRPERKTRSDKGKRAVDLKTDPDLKLVAGWVIEYDIKPADALLMAKERGMNIPIKFHTFLRYLKENGLGKQTRRNPVTPHVRFEADAPGAMYQFDMSGTKERWYDHKTRKIVSVSKLEVSKNHENSKLTRVKVWRFSLIDDHSRRIFVRYVAVLKPNSSHVVDFLLQAYSHLGVPFKLYSDNDVVIKYARNAQAAKILNKALEDEGGYELTQHLPGNARATGKVERLHQAVEQDEKFIGLYLAERGELTIDILNEKFAPAVENKKNNTVHRETGEKPLDRWNAKFSVVRKLDYELLKSAFEVDEFEVLLRGDLTFRLKGKGYQLPTGDQFPFASWINQKIQVLFPDNLEFFTVIGLDGFEYDVVKEIAAPSVAGDFHAVAETGGEKLRKEVKAIAKADAKTKKAAFKSGENAAPIPFFDIDFAPAEEKTNVTPFPKPETHITPQKIVAAAPGRTSGIYSGILLDYWEAVNKFDKQFASKAECKSFMDALFESRESTCRLAQSEIESALEKGVPTVQPVRRLKAV